MITTTRTLCDLQGNHHYLEVGNDSLLLDGRHCRFLDITHERIQIACTDTPQPIVFATGCFWRDIAGAAPSDADAGELLAHRLAAWTSQRALLHTLQSLQTQLYEQGAESSLLPNYRLDPLIEKLLRKFDGTDDMAQMLADILDQSPEVVRSWATQFQQDQLTGAGNNVPKPELDSFTEPEECVRTGPLATLAPTESLREASAQQPTQQRSRKTQEEWFFWTPERERTLETAANELGGLEQKFSQATIRQIAARLGYPHKSVEYKLARWKKGLHSREQQEPSPVPQEEDRPTAASSDSHPLLAAS